MAIQFSIISSKLQNWYLHNHRKLPWRETINPYEIWISEIILQQTRVNQGLNYYIRLLQRFSDIKSLANAEEDEVLKYWQGLGYYSRARNLHKAAKQIENDFNGIFPTSYADVLKLSGIGEYTAAAICSFAYNQAYAVLDGNVYRVLSRLFGEHTAIDTSEGKHFYWNLANELLDKNNPATHNQAIMEFGALQCVPVSPDCGNCILNEHCLALAQNEVELLPVKEKKTKVSKRFFNYLIIKNKTVLLLRKRTEKDIWQGLYDFPLIESNKLLSNKELTEDKDFKKLFENINSVSVIFKKTSSPFKHILSHQILTAQFVEIDVPEFSQEMKNQFIQVEKDKLDDYAIPRLIEIYLEERR